MAQIRYIDQSSRSLLYEAIVNCGRDSDEYKQQKKAMRESDSLNIIKFKSLIDLKGWPDVERVGEAQMTTVFLVLVHADLEDKRFYYPFLEQSVASGDLPKGAWATFIDKMKANEGKKQIYGTQLELNDSSGKYELYPVEDVNKLNERRFEMELDSIEVYMRRMDEAYNQ